jgi:uncharacterized membrane protein YeaQ/YmgE (transglycosylase-associated protein family)
MDETSANVLGGAVGGVIGLILVAAVGLVIGGIAKLLVPGKDPGGWLVTILLGIAGSWMGSLLTARFGLIGFVPGVLGAILGAMLILSVHRLVRKR